jgi:hypothetical protein
MAAMNRWEPAVRRYLGGKNVTLWADWDLTNAGSMESAVIWLTDQITAVVALAGADSQHCPPRFDSFTFDDQRRNLPA